MNIGTHTDDPQNQSGRPKVLVEYKLNHSDSTLIDHPYWKDIKWIKSPSIRKGSLVTSEKNFNSRNLLKVGLVIQARGKRASILYPRKSTLAHISKTKLLKFTDCRKLDFWKESLRSRFKRLSEKKKQKYQLRGK